MATGFISCDNFLDITPVGKVIPTTATEFRALMTQAYVSTPKSGRARTAFRSDEVGSLTDTESRSLYFEEWTWDDYSPDYSSDFGWRQDYQALFLINYTIENENKIRIFSNFYLPISIIKTTNKEIEEIQKTYTIKEATNKAIAELEEELDKEIENKEKIVNKNINTYENEGTVDVYVTYEVLENIGTNEKIVF